MSAKPPALARALLRLVAGSDAGPIEGDLAEALSARGSGWYRRQVVASLPHLLVMRLGGVPFRRLGRGVGAGIAAFLLVFVASVLTATSVFAAVPVAAALRLIAYLGGLFVATTVASLVATRVARSVPAGWSLGGVAVLFVLAMFVVSPEAEPAAAWIVWPSVCVGGALLGVRRPSFAYHVRR